MKVIKRFKEKPDLIAVCYKCHTVLHIEFRDLKVFNDPSPGEKYPWKPLHDLHFRCPVCKTVQGGNWKPLEIHWKIHDDMIRKARERYDKLSPSEQQKKRVI